MKTKTILPLLVVGLTLGVSNVFAQTAAGTGPTDFNSTSSTVVGNTEMDGSGTLKSGGARGWMSTTEPTRDAGFKLSWLVLLGLLGVLGIVGLASVLKKPKRSVGHTDTRSH